MKIYKAITNAWLAGGAISGVAGLAGDEVWLVASIICMFAWALLRGAGKEEQHSNKPINL